MPEAAGLEPPNVGSLVDCSTICATTSDLSLDRVLERGARKLTGENLKVVWAEFSTLSLGRDTKY